MRLIPMRSSLSWCARDGSISRRSSRRRSRWRICRRPWKLPRRCLATSSWWSRPNSSKSCRRRGALLAPLATQVIARRRETSMDPLSDILNMLTVERAASIRFESSGPYALRFAGYRHIKFGAVLCGHVRLAVSGDPEPLDLGPGDCYLLTDGRPYRTWNCDGAPEIDGNALFAE